MEWVMYALLVPAIFIFWKIFDWAESYLDRVTAENELRKAQAKKEMELLKNSS